MRMIRPFAADIDVPHIEFDVIAAGHEREPERSELAGQ